MNNVFWLSPVLLKAHWSAHLTRKAHGLMSFIKCVSSTATRRPYGLNMSDSMNWPVYIECARRWNIMALNYFALAGHCYRYCWCYCYCYGKSKKNGAGLYTCIRLINQPLLSCLLIYFFSTYMCSTVIIHLNIENGITMCVCKVNWEEEGGR